MAAPNSTEEDVRHLLRRTESVGRPHRVDALVALGSIEASVANILAIPTSPPSVTFTAPAGHDWARLGAPAGPVGAACEIAVRVAGVGGVAPRATAVVVNVTATGASEETYVTAYSDEVARPHASSLSIGTAARSRPSCSPTG